MSESPFKTLVSPNGFDGRGPVPEKVSESAKRIARLRTKFVNQRVAVGENPLTQREVDQLFQACAIQAEWTREVYDARDALEDENAIANSLHDNAVGECCRALSELNEVYALVAKLRSERDVGTNLHSSGTHVDDCSAHRLSPEEIAVEIMRSEAMMWLMAGGDENWVGSHLHSLRPAWKAYIDAGGSTYGNSRG